MGTFSTGVGLISGIDTASLINQLLALESRPKQIVQQRLSILQAQKAATLDINARLLSLKNAARGFRINNVFSAVTASSSNPDALTATGTTNAQPGSFSFIVKQLVTSSQRTSGGFANQNSTPLGLESLSFEFGNGLLERDRELEDLNAGQGVRRGRITITNRAGASATVDLRDVTTLNEVLDRINDSGISVAAAASGDRIVLTDSSGGGGNLVVANAAGSFTAIDLGIAGSVAANTLTGTVINSLGSTTTLTSLNDGNGVTIRSNVPDLRITARDGRVFEVNLGRIDAQIDEDTELEDLNNGAGIAINATDAPDFKIISRSGETVDINLGQVIDEDDQVIDEAVETVGQLLDRVNETLELEFGAGQVVLSIDPDENRFVLTDLTAGAGTTQVVGAGPGNNETAQDLGLLAVDGGTGDADSTVDGILTGALVPNAVQSASALTLEDVIDRINESLDTLDAANGGAIVASIAADGVSLQITDATAGAGNLIVRGFSSDADQPNAARDLGIYTGEAGVASATVNGSRLVGALNSVLMRSINGGSGLDGGTSLTFTDREGDALTINSLDTHDSLSDLLTAVQSAIDADGTVDVTLGLNATGTGLLVSDTSGSTAGNLIVGGNAAAALGIATAPAGVAANDVRGTNLQLRYVSEASRLSDLNYGRGIGTGSFRITDGFGESAVVTIGSDATTLFDVIQEINSRGLAIRARINDRGDGLLIEQDPDETDTPFVPIKIQATSGSAAKDLNILGTSSTIEDPVIDGSYERTVDVSASDTLATIRTKINQAGIPVSASIMNTGSGATPFRLSLTSGIGGSRGEMIIDTGDVDLGFTTVQTGQDAKVFFGSSDISQAFLVTSSTNQVTNVLEGVTVNLLEAGDDPITLTIARDDEAVVGSMQGFVTAFNDVIARLDQYDFFDVETEERGVLLGDPTVGRVRQQVYRTLQQRAVNVEGSFQLLSQIGLKAGKDGQLAFDEARFREVLTNDRESVEALLASFESTTETTQEIFPGVTVTTNEETATTIGFGDLFDRMLGSLTDSVDGSLPRVDRNYQSHTALGHTRGAQYAERLARRRVILEAQFAAMEAALARLQGQSNALVSMASNVNLARAS